MTTCKLKHSVFSLLLVSIFSISCNGQNSTTRNEQLPKIVRTFKTTSETLHCELLDKDGNLWFSINGEGAYRYDGKLFTNFSIKDGLCNNNVVAIIQDKSGNILFGTNRGICKYDGKTFITIPMTDTLSITSLLEDREGNIWFGVINKGIYRYDGKNVSNFLDNYQHPFYGDKYEKFISDIIQDKKGNIWFSSWNGGGVWKFDGKILTQFLPPIGYYKTNQDKRATVNTQNNLNFNSDNNSFIQSQDYISDDMIFSMTEDNLGNIWFATRNHGICYYNGKTFISIGSNKGFASSKASAILQDEKNNFWITTFDSGVWNYDGKIFKNFTENNGLVNNAVLNLIKDKDGNLWFGTKFVGLSRYDGKSFTTFSKYDN
jgi:ligand-binding sensor domain-containing protein